MTAYSQWLVAAGLFWVSASGAYRRGSVNRPPAAVVAAALLSLLVVPTSVHGQSRFDDVRLIVGSHGFVPLVRGEGFDDVRGVLTSDVQLKQLRFETGSQVLFEAPFDRLSSLHYEESRYPPRAFRRSTPYLTIHHLSAAGEPAFTILRLSRDLAPRILEQLERDTGLRVDRSPPTTSFMGLPIHLAVGRRVYVTDSAGQRTRGEVRGISPSSIDLGTSGHFEAASVRQIDLIDPTWDGAATGMLLFLLPAGLVGLSECYESCATLGPFSVGSWGVLGAGAVIGALIDRNRMRNAYRGQEPGTSPRVEWRPVFDDNRKALHLSLRF